MADQILASSVFGECDDLVGIGDGELVDEFDGGFRGDVEIIVTDDALRVDDDGPGSAGRSVVAHELVGGTSFADVAYRNGEMVFLGGFFSSCGCVGSMAFKDGLDGDESDVGVFLIVLDQLLQGGETVAMAAGAPGLEAVEVEDFALEIRDVE